MLPDTRIITRHSAFTVLGEAQTVVFRDSTAAQLHRVQRDLVDSTYLRALCLDGTTWCVFDLRHIHRDFQQDFPTLLARDHGGVVLYTLRREFPSAASFIVKAFQEFTHVWPVDEPVILDIPADALSDRLVHQPELRRAMA